MTIFIALGANVRGPAGPPRVTLEAALARLEASGIKIVRRSRWYRSPAWPDPAEPEYLNAVAAIETSLDAGALMQLLHGIEASLGRVRGRPNAPRTIDLDLLDFRGLVEGGSQRDRRAQPVLPHPRMHQRAFVLFPLAEIDPGWRHPVSRRAIGDLIAALPGDTRAEPMS